MTQEISFGYKMKRIKLIDKISTNSEIEAIEKLYLFTDFNIEEITCSASNSTFLFNNSSNFSIFECDLYDFSISKNS